LPFFAAAVIVNYILGGAGITANLLAIAFVLLRALFICLYLTGKQGVRSIVWTAALAVNIAIFFLPLVFQYL
jgi:uncharacterized MAPEG superfamily protein